MPLRQSILSFILICFCFVSRSFGETNFTDYRASDCNRRCTTGYSDETCWSSSFEFFIRDMINSMNNYLGTATNLSSLDNESKKTLLNEIKSFESKLIENFLDHLEKEADTDLEGILIDLQHLFNYTQIQFEQIINQQSKEEIYFKKCPTDSGCFKENTQLFNSYKLFTSFTSALTLALVIVYIVTYLFVENKFVKKFK